MEPMTKTRVMWNRWIANPLEHYYTTDDKFYPKPLCGQELSLVRANFADQPTGLARLCNRCEKKLEL